VSTGELVRSIASTGARAGSIQGVLEGLSGPLEARGGKLDDRPRMPFGFKASGNRGASLPPRPRASSGELNCRGSFFQWPGALKQRRPAKEAPGRQGRINKLTGKVSAVTRTQIQVIFAARATGCRQ
jgi:hypothetical protein